MQSNSLFHGLCRQFLTVGLQVGAVAARIGLHELWGISDSDEIDQKVKEGAGLRSEGVAEVIVFMPTRLNNITICELIMSHVLRICEVSKPANGAHLPNNAKQQRKVTLAIFATDWLGTLNYTHTVWQYAKSQYSSRYWLNILDWIDKPLNTVCKRRPLAKCMMPWSGNL